MLSLARCGHRVTSVHWLERKTSVFIVHVTLKEVLADGTQGGGGGEPEQDRGPAPAQPSGDQAAPFHERLPRSPGCLLLACREERAGGEGFGEASLLSKVWWPELGPSPSATGGWEVSSEGGLGKVTGSVRQWSAPGTLIVNR